MTSNDVEFQMWTSYHPAVGFQEKGHNEFYFRSRCGRWHARQGAPGTMILTDKDNDTLQVVSGKMPEVEALVNEILSSHPREYR